MLLKTRLLVLAVFSMSAVVVTTVEGGESVAFRSRDWQGVHAKDAADADKTLATLRKLGCETKIENHGDHSDIAFRSVEWREVTLESHENADRWEQWLNKKGFETVHGHAHAPSENAIVVEYVSSEWKVQHFDDEKKAAEFVAICKGLGCEVQKDSHSGHLDVSFRCPSRRSLICIDHDEAHSMQSWLEKKGFQTEHVH